MTTDQKPLTEDEVTVISLRCRDVAEEPWVQVLSSHTEGEPPSASTFTGREFIYHARREVPRLVFTIQFLRRQAMHNDHCLQLANEQIHEEARRRNTAWSRNSYLETKVETLEAENKELRKPKPEERVDSVGTCKRCHYHGAGPAHDCIGRLVRQVEMLQKQRDSVVRERQVMETRNRELNRELENQLRQQMGNEITDEALAILKGESPTDKKRGRPYLALSKDDPRYGPRDE